MSILWELGSATGRQIHERLDDELDYTTVLTVLRTMEEKGYVRHEQEGRAYRYHPVVGRDEAGETALRRLVEKFFGGSPERFLAHLVPGEEELDPGERARLEELIRGRLESAGGEGEER
jgi:predicted transcriptional regulator